MRMTKIRGQFGQMRIDINVGTIPGQKRSNGKTMSQVMKTGAMRDTWFAQSDPAGKLKEPSVHCGVAQAFLSLRNEETETGRLRIMFFSNVRIPLQCMPS